MAAIDLRSAQLPTKYRTASLGTTWQEFILPAGVRYTTQSGTAAHYLANGENGDPASPETPADGGAVGTHYLEVAAGSPYTERMPGRHHDRSSQSLFVASASGSIELTLSLEEAEQ